MKILVKLIGIIILVSISNIVLGQFILNKRQFLVDASLNIKQYRSCHVHSNKVVEECEAILSKNKDTLSVYINLGDGETYSYLLLNFSKYNRVVDVSWHWVTDVSYSDEYKGVQQVSDFKLSLNKSPFDDSIKGLVGELVVDKLKGIRSRNKKIVFILDGKIIQDDNIPKDKRNRRYFEGNVFNQDSSFLIGALVMGFWKEDYCIEQTYTDIDGHFSIRGDGIKYFEIYSLNNEIYRFTPDNIKDKAFNVYLKNRIYDCPSLKIARKLLLIDSTLYQKNLVKIPSRYYLRKFWSNSYYFEDSNQIYRIANPEIGYESFYKSLVRYPFFVNLRSKGKIEIIFSVGIKGEVEIESVNSNLFSSNEGFSTYFKNISEWQSAKSRGRIKMSKYRMIIEIL